MAIHTNDCFVGMNSLLIEDGTVVRGPGYDAGTEENNEDCAFIPGPFCTDISTTNNRTDSGEGFVHIHPGIHGIADMLPSKHDWRNPMIQVSIALL